jgi:hypothetical protein
MTRTGQNKSYDVETSNNDNTSTSQQEQHSQHRPLLQKGGDKEHRTGLRNNLHTENQAISECPCWENLNRAGALSAHLHIFLTFLSYISEIISYFGFLFTISSFKLF